MGFVTGSIRGRVIDFKDRNTNHSVWYTYSTDSTGQFWAPLTLVFSAVDGKWDYPSVGADGSGRVIVGAVKFVGASSSYWTALSADGATFPAGNKVQTPVPIGARARVVAANDRFHVFAHRYQGSSPVGVDRYESTTV